MNNSMAWMFIACNASNYALLFIESRVGTGIFAGGVMAGLKRFFWGSQQ